MPTGDPLAGTLVRTVASTNRLPGRHKTLYDQYTRPDLGKTRKTERLQGYLQSRISSLTVGEARKALTPALANETLRSRFMELLLTDIHDFAEGTAMQQVADAASSSLHTFDMAA